LNEELNQLIDDLIVKSNNARVNRSSIVRMALESLAEQTPEEFQALVHKKSQ
jgi:Arc/MetJ-type ribon-helix-helix transcriptional regulator